MDAPAPDLAALRRAADELDLVRATRHVLLCVPQTKPKCCAREVSEAVWEHLKRRLKELGLVAPGATASPRVLRSRVDCLRVCRDGPIAVVYPEGTWYHSVTVPVMERILLEHVVGGRPVEDHVFARTPVFPS